MISHKPNPSTKILSITKAEFAEVGPFFQEPISFPENF